VEHVTKRLVLAAVVFFMLTTPNLAAAAPSISSISSPIVVGDSFTVNGADSPTVP
jgi:hypothetical protein